MENLRIELSKNLKPKPQDETKLGFGNIFTDHMFLMDYDEGQGWHDARIVPYGPLPLDPAAMALHYSQEVFEGMKAYRAEDGRILLFRPQENFARLNRSNERLCIPQIDEEFALKALIELLKIEKDWIPHIKDTSLYIRPFIIATDAHLGVRTANRYLFVIILSPSGPYYKEGLNPVKLYVENNYVRAVRGGTGMAKTGGNYAASLKAQVEANDQNYSQVLWLDGVEKKYIEEVGSMNVFFVIDGEVITPALVGSILPGITRKSCIEMLKDMGYKVTERRLSIQEVADAYKAGKLNEAFGTGTAAVISPIGHIKWGDLVMDINNNEIGEISQKLYDELTGIQWGRIPDRYNWIVEVK
ncbi:MAG: branched-chain amino acid aminotransferase [Candidatus Pararuminococcus gallinarum]|uniref:branched-chain amino acid aminotransferase n=1 Tax=Zongyangia sp. HA2173 TaxID=3133035 RepID=UPI00174B093C